MELLRNGVEVDYLDIVLENCEVMRVATTSIKHFEMKTEKFEQENYDGDVKEKITRLEIGIKAKDIEEMCFGLLSDYGCLNRIWNRRDITQVSFVTNYIDENNFEEETLYVHWSEECDNENVNQKSYLDQEDNSLEIYIKEEAKKPKQHSIYLEKELVLQYIKETKSNILKKDMKSAYDIGGLNMLERISLDIKSGKFDKNLF